MDSSDLLQRGIELDQWTVVALPGAGTYVTDGDVAYQIGGHSTDTRSSKKLEREYAKMMTEGGNT